MAVISTELVQAVRLRTLRGSARTKTPIVRDDLCGVKLDTDHVPSDLMVAERV